MKEQHHVIWSNRDLDYDDWKDDLEAEYPDLSDNERYALMYEINNGYLEDERVNLDISLGTPILLIADLGRWNGRFPGYGEIASGNIKDCLIICRNTTRCRSQCRCCYHGLELYRRTGIQYADPGWHSKDG